MSRHKKKNKKAASEKTEPRKPRRPVPEDWDLERARSLPTEEVLAKLVALGRPMTAADFILQAEGTWSSAALAAQWLKRLKLKASSADALFVEFAAFVLWERLLPLRPSSEMIEEAIDDGYLAQLDDELEKTCDLWLKAWELLKTRLTPEMREIPEIDDILTLDLIAEWTDELEMTLADAALKNPTYYQHRVRYCQEYYTQFPAEDPSILETFYQGEAESYWGLGQRAEAERLFEALVQRHPDSADSYIGWANCYWSDPPPTPDPKEYDRAVAIFERALAQADLDSRGNVYDHLADLYEETGDEEKAERYRALANKEGEAELDDRLRPGRDHDPWLDAGNEEEEEALQPSAFGPTETYRRLGPKLGRNDPCWCGSGKKYKRCHLASDEQAQRDQR